MIHLNNSSYLCTKKEMNLKARLFLFVFICLQIGYGAPLYDYPESIWPMALDKAHSLEQALADKAIIQQESVPLSGWTHTGIGMLSHSDSILQMCMPLSTGTRAQGPADDPDYAIFGTCSAELKLGGRNLKDYNQLAFDIRTDLEAGIANMNVDLQTEPTCQLGAHLVNIQGTGWQHVVYQISELPLACVNAIRIYTDLKGRNLSRQDSIHYYIKNIQWQKAESIEPYQGWQTAAGHIAYSMSGYLVDGAKTAIIASTISLPFFLIDEYSGDTVFHGESTMPATTLDGTFQVLDFSSLSRQGIYRLIFDTLATEPFPISQDALQGSEWKILNFIHGQRCGQHVSGIHGLCHTDVFCDHNGHSYTYGGGWHDAGDLSQQTLQTADVTYALLEAYSKRKDTNPQLASLLLDEARHGLAQISRCRLGDGWHASSIGLLHWTDGITGTFDDIHTVRKQNLAFDNFLYAAYEAYAARLLGEDSLRQAAIEDFNYASSKYERDGIDSFHIAMEHTYNTSAVTYMAAASWAASQLYLLTGREKYGRLAAGYASQILDCQKQDGHFAGYFYRDSTRKAIIHYIHQSREQLPIQALIALCETQPLHPDYSKWHKAISLYGNYLKSIMFCTQPYGMMPSGIYHSSEYADEDGFKRLHLWAPENAHQLYDQQLKEGIQIDQHHYLRRFPVWFSIFNGNEAVILSTGKAAALCGRFLKDDKLMNLGLEQLYWTVGKNPFCQSLIYGEGHRYPSMDSFSSGEIMGEIPVGIRSFGNTDQPFWPLTNNACYKEVWLTSAGKWLSLTSEYK